MFKRSDLLSYPAIRRFMATLRYGMSQEDLKHLRAAWKVVNDAPIPVGKLFFKLLFETHSQYQNWFKVRSIPAEGLVHNQDFTPHIKAVMSSLNRIVTRFENDKSVDEVITYVAKSHKSSRQEVGRKEMENMGIAIKEALRALNKDKFTKETEAAFDKFYRGFVDDYESRLNRGGKTKPNEKK